MNIIDHHISMKRHYLNKCLLLELLRQIFKISILPTQVAFELRVRFSSKSLLNQNGWTLWLYSLHSNLHFLPHFSKMLFAQYYYW